MQSISIDQYFKEYKEWPIIDVRSPGEYHKGHIPDAINMPLFNDEERAEVGTLYKQKSKKAAILRGLDIAGGKMSSFVQEAHQLFRDKEVAVHCWRGGKRSGSVATLLEFVGFKVVVVKGGYKAYRNLILNTFKERKLKLIVLGGKTGSGKSDVLHKMKEAGEQIIDLEGLAHHKGSAFGALGEEPQPTVEQFENNLYEAFMKLDVNRRVWIENESKSIGRVYVPDGLWHQKIEADFLEMEIPFEKRVQLLVKLYGDFSKEELLTSLSKISKRLGGLNMKNAIQAFEKGDLKTATEIALKYYDKAYQHAADKKNFKTKHQVKVSMEDVEKAAAELIEFANEQYS